MSEQTLKSIIDERNKDIKLQTVAKIADGFGMSIEESFMMPFLIKKFDIE